MPSFWMTLARAIVWRDAWITPQRNEAGRRAINPQYALDYMAESHIDQSGLLGVSIVCKYKDLEQIKDTHPNFYAYHINRNAARQP